MTTKTQMYDYPGYNIRFGVGGDAGGAATTAYAKFAAFTTMIAYSASLNVAVVGTAGTSTWQFQQVNTSGTTTLALFTLATGTVGKGSNVALSTATGGISLAQNDMLQLLSGGDVAAKLAVGWELGLAQNASVTV